MDMLFKGITRDVLNSILTFNPDPIFLLGEKGEVLDVNIAGANLFGYSASEWVDINFQDIIAPENVKLVAELFANTLKGEYCSYNVSAYNKEGELLHLYVKKPPSL